MSVGSNGPIKTVHRLIDALGKAIEHSRPTTVESLQVSAVSLMPQDLVRVDLSQKQFADLMAFLRTL